MQREFSLDQLAELRELADGKSFAALSHNLLNAVDPDAQADKAREIAGGGEPSEEQRNTAVGQLVQEAVTPFMKAKFRRRLLEIRLQNEQTIDRHTIDAVIYSGFDAAALDKAQTKIKDFRCWIEENHGELTALQLLYTGTRPLRLKLKDLRDLSEAIARPPLSATPTQLWRAFQAADAGKVKGPGGKQLADLVNLVRHALAPETELAPYREELAARYESWLKERDAEKPFTREQREWLDRMAEHIATSLSIEPEDFDYGWFGQNGSLSKAHLVFGRQLTPLISELNSRLAQ
jgi:type I restriction enzyme R subunit